MALPVLKSIYDCANFTETVQPYLYQLKPLPSVVFESVSNPLALKQIYLDTNPLISSFALAFALAPIFLLAAEVNRNYSQVDRFWSILPTLHIAHYTLWAHLSGLHTERMDLLLAVSTIWSCRLTFNYWRRGGYSIGSEDYRWVIVLNYVGQPWFFLFDVVFIAFIQMLLLCMIATPAYVLLLTSRLATLQNKPAIEVGDYIAAGMMLTFVTISAIADQQQWTFHVAKDEYKKTGHAPAGWDAAELERGFRSSGLFAASRHPNFAAEQSVWLSLHAWSCYSAGAPFNWTGFGALSYLALFQGSTWLTELITSGKYPAYKQYQAQVGRFFPNYGAQPPQFIKVRGEITNNGTPNKDASKARERYDLR